MKVPPLPIKQFFHATSAVVCLGLVSCTTTSPESRIEKNQVMLEKLSSSHQELVKKGDIDTGMTKDAVYLAWGKPDREVDLYSNDIRSTRWEYHTLQPIVTHRFYGGIGFGSGYRHSKYSRYGRRHFSHNTFGIGTGIHYTPVRAATVLYENNKVKSWQTER